VTAKNLRRRPQKVEKDSRRPARLVSLLLRWFNAHARDLPWRRTHDPYAIWVSEIMLQQTQVKTVIPYWERWMRTLPDVQALADASPDTIHKLWEGLGYYTRVRNMQAAAREIVALHAGRFPSDYDAILALPGIGRYTAGAVASIAFNQPKPIMDGNVIRVLTRLFGITGNPHDRRVNEKLWSLAGKLVAASAPNCSAFNQSLMELGALVCTPRQPRCPVCPLNRDCSARRTGKIPRIPNLGPRPSATALRFIAFVVEQNGRYLARQRPAGVVNAHLWEFPNFEVPPDFGNSDLPAVATKAVGIRPKELYKLQTIRHTITRYRITMDVYRAVLLPDARAPKSSEGRWLTVRELHKLAFSSAHRRIAEKLRTL
jgi:A/G-specific adenine glycosylase